MREEEVQSKLSSDQQHLSLFSVAKSHASLGELTQDQLKELQCDEAFARAMVASTTVRKSLPERPKSPLSGLTGETLFRLLEDEAYARAMSPNAKAQKQLSAMRREQLSPKKP